MGWDGHRRNNTCIKNFGLQISGVEITLPKGTGKQNIRMHLREQYAKLRSSCVQLAQNRVH
jgi:hypothetical protein